MKMKSVKVDPIIGTIATNDIIPFAFVRALTGNSSAFDFRPSRATDKG
jgi:hypothetical protein